MKYRSWILILSVCILFLQAGCQSAYTQQSLAVETPSPADSPAISTTPVQPALGDTTPHMELPRPDYTLDKRSYNCCNVEGPFVAITFDDGPKPGQTDRLLDILKARGIKATFFVIGQNAAAHPELIQRIIAEGHEIGNHSWNHASLTKVGAAGVASQINQTDAAVTQAGAPKPIIMRPPYGATNTVLNKRLNEEFGKKVVLWDVDPLDWKYRNSARVTNEILKNAKPGSIILAHDIHASTVNAMPATLDALLQKGYKFVTVSELIAMDRPKLAKKPAPQQQSTQ